MTKTLIIFAAVFIAIFIPLNQAVLNRYDVPYPLENIRSFKADFRTDYRAMINREQPRAVVIGDSAIRELDEAVFSDVLERETLIFSAPGSGSAYWYLFFRHQVLQAQNPPDVVLFFFRGATLTEPDYLVNGSYRIRLEEVASSEDDDVYALTVGQNQNALVNLLERFLPLFAYRSTIYQDWVTFVRNWLPGLLFDCGNACVDEAFDQVFDDNQINAVLWEDLQRELDKSIGGPENYDFNARLGSSLLPLILKDARNAGILPVFVRVEYRSQAAGEPEDDLMLEYMQELQHYIQQNGGLYIDPARFGGLEPEMYRDEIHLNDEDAAAASAIIAQVIADQLKFFPRN
jgi:hypothetical protein